MFCKKGVLTNFTKIHRKTPVPESLFNEVAGLRSATLLKKRLWHRCFPVNFAKFLRTPFIIEHVWWLFLNFPANVNILRLHFSALPPPSADFDGSYLGEFNIVGKSSLLTPCSSSLVSLAGV